VLVHDGSLLGLGPLPNQDGGRSVMNSLEVGTVGTNISAKTDTVNGPITDDKTKSVTYADVVRR